MGSDKETHPLDVGPLLRLEGWKVAIAVGVAIILAPVVALVLLVLIGTLLPVLPILATLLARCWLVGQHSAVASAPLRAPRVLGSPVSHHSAS
jgi:hypothetical protein